MTDEIDTAKGGPEPLAMLQSTTERNGSTVIVSATGEIDASNQDAWECVVGEIATTTVAPGPLVIDVRGLDFMAGCAFGVLARGAEHCRRRDVSLRVVSNRPIVARIVAACGLRTLLPIYPTIDTALSQDTGGHSGE
jgi:anti-anti-sigma factor